MAKVAGNRLREDTGGGTPHGWRGGCSTSPGCSRVKSVVCSRVHHVLHAVIHLLQHQADRVLVLPIHWHKANQTEILDQRCDGCVQPVLLWCRPSWLWVIGMSHVRQKICKVECDLKRMRMGCFVPHRFPRVNQNPKRLRGGGGGGAELSPTCHQAPSECTLDQGPSKIAFNAWRHYDILLYELVGAGQHNRDGAQCNPEKEHKVPRE